MGGFLRTLAKVGLVELDESEQERPAAATAAAAPAGDVDMADIERLLAEDTEALVGGASEAPSSGPASSAPVAPTMVVSPAPGAGPSGPAVGGSTAIAEGRPFSEIYAEAAVQPSAFPAEKMIRVLDGLRAMDPNTRKAAVMAMDMADDAWSVDDSVLDAQRKIQVLQTTTAAMAETVNQAAAKAAADIQAQETYQAQATDSIRKQIADLEALLQEEMSKVAQEKAAIEAGLKATRESFERETARINQEIEKLQEIFRIFATPGTTGPASG